MGKVKRLPVQHLQKPHCATCGGPLPNLNGIQVMLGSDDGSRDWEVLGITFHLQCKCGSRWDLRKDAKK